LTSQDTALSIKSIKRGFHKDAIEENEKRKPYHKENYFWFPEEHLHE